MDICAIQYHGKEVLEPLAVVKTAASNLDCGQGGRVCPAVSLFQLVQVFALLPEICTWGVGFSAKSELQKVQQARGVDY